ncbi:hypothetical protein DCAR_0206139 [Daucus carota subsp. sativus]|uniref:peptidylprolyl isomerase n=1 Tax=Daucus carota subsp. sativus TaxID=79200 RepID=A0AAF0WF68_DAUCS|nr:hypothetical protein DCAR_0206139 [Daucus carota subsp. sativus]
MLLSFCGSSSSCSRYITLGPSPTNKQWVVIETQMRYKVILLTFFSLMLDYVEVCGAKTQEIFNEVFTKMVAAAQPIPGFRRVKGGKTPDIPRDILLEVLGPSKVYKEVIKKVINSAISEYVKKERLIVGKNVRVEQSFDDLEAIFEPGDSFQFDAVVQCQQSNES